VSPEPLRILIVNSGLAARDRDSGSLRLFRLLELLAQEGHRIMFLAREGFGQERAVAELAGLGIDVYPVDLDRLRDLGATVPGTGQDFRDLLARGRFDLAIVSFFNVAEQYVPLIRALSPLTRIVIDTVDVHHVRERRGAELTGDPIALAGAETIRRRERAIYGAADALVAVSGEDAGALRELAPHVPSFVISNVHLPEPPTPGFAERAGLVFVGGFPHLPNVDAVLDFHRHAWPRVRSALPGAQLTVVGIEPPPEITGLSGPALTVTGWVPEVAPYLDRARVSIAPLRYGAGVKGKIGEAMSRGLPVVTTAVGAEGMGLVDGEHALVADDPEAFAAAVVRLHGDRALWERLAANGRAQIERLLGPRAALEGLRALLEAVASTPFVVSASSRAAEDALTGYLGAFAAGDRSSLVLTVAAGDDGAARAALGWASDSLARRGLEPDHVADIQIAGLEPDGILPGRTVAVADGEAATTVADGRRVAPAAPAAVWRELAASGAPPRRPRATPRAALVVHALDHAPALESQLEALGRSRLPGDVEVVIAADAPGPGLAALLGTLAGATVIRGTGALGRHQAWQLGAHATRAPFVVALAPLAIPAPGFLDGLLEAVAGGAALAGPTVSGAAGLRIAADGSLWPRAAGSLQDDGPRTTDGALGALALDCLAAPRELIADGLPVPPRGEGHAEAQLAAWAARRGGIAHAPASLVRRLGVPLASVIVTTRNRAEELPDCIALLLASGATDVVIVDNASSDHTVAVASELAARSTGRVRLVHEPRAGNGHARNAGAAAARHDLLLYIDDDARPAPGWLEHMSFTLARPGVVNAGGPISALWPAQRSPGWPGRVLEPLLSVLDLGDVERTLVPPDIVYGASWAVRREALDAIGGFDPAIGYGPSSRVGGNEVSVAWRLHDRRLGATVYTPGAAVGHRIAPGRVTDGFMVGRALSVGVERVLHLRELRRAEPERLLEMARSAAAQVVALAPIGAGGEVTVAQAFERISGSDSELGIRVQAAMALGEMAASVGALGESEVMLGDLRLVLDPDAILRGVLDTLPAQPGSLRAAA